MLSIMHITAEKIAEEICVKPLSLSNLEIEIIEASFGYQLRKKIAK